MWGLKSSLKLKIAAEYMAHSTMRKHPGSTAFMLPSIKGVVWQPRTLDKREEYRTFLELR
jgi:hypothetical protein